jgi:hypothetical protein
MSVHNPRSIQPPLPFDASHANKPLGRVQLYLIELKTVLVLLREVLVEVKELIVVAAIIYIFILGVVDLIHRMHPPP